MSEKMIGLHSPIWIEPELLAEALLDIEKMGARMAVGDKVSALEKLGMILLVVNEKVPAWT